jgi:hypothetical protein
MAFSKAYIWAAKDCSDATLGAVQAMTLFLQKLNQLISIDNRLLCIEIYIKYMASMIKAKENAIRVGSTKMGKYRFNVFCISLSPFYKHRGRGTTTAPCV